MMEGMTAKKAPLWGAHEIAQALGVSKQRAHKLIKHREFPAHIEVLGQGRIWSRAEVEAWIAAHRRPRPDAGD
jgi:prophage regulatory protein